MKEVSLSGSPRENVGKKDAKAIRNSGRIPCVVYGSGSQTHFTTNIIDMEKIIKTPEVNLVNINLGEKKVKAIVQAIQFHPVTDHIQHVDFLEVNENKKVKVDVPVRLSGRSVGVMSGGKLQQVFRKLKVQALPQDLPDSINIDITEMRIGSAVRIKDLNTDKVTILNPPNAVAVSIKAARGAVETAAEGAEGDKAAAKK